MKRNNIIKPQVCIVTLSWNGANYLDSCLRSLSKQSFKDFKVFIVDNGSSDNSFDVYKKFSGVLGLSYIRLQKNEGYARGNNIAINKALIDEPDYIILLNNDTVPDADWLFELVRYMDKNKHVSLAQGINYLENNKIDSNGIYLEEGYIPRQRSSGLRDFNWKIPTIGPNAAGAIIQSSAIKKLLYKGQLLDESFFAYVEDVDLMYRATSRGFIHGYAKKARLMHLGSQTGKKVPNKKMYWGARNNIRMIYKNITPGVWKIKRKKIILSQLANLEFLFKTDKKLYFSYLLGIFSGILSLPLYFNKRKCNLLNNILTDDEVLKYLVPSNPPLTNPVKLLHNRFIK